MIRMGAHWAAALHASSVVAQGENMCGRGNAGLFTGSPPNTLPRLPLSGRLAHMENERIERAMARIEAAARRLETAAARAPAAVPASDTDLVAKHDLLRREAWAALAELDSLIETIEA